MEENIKYDDESKGNRKGLPGQELPGQGLARQLPQRKSIRLKGYDYSQAGLYFITICCDGMKHRFGKIENGVMILNELGQIAQDEWMKLLERFPNMELNAFQIMPNHMHGIIELSVRATLAVALKSPTAEKSSTETLNEAAEASRDKNLRAASDNQALRGEDKPLRAGDKPLWAGASPAHTDVEGLRLKATLENCVIATIGEIVGAYKSLVFNGCLKIFKLKNERMGKLWHRNYYEHIIKNEQAYQNITKYIINNPAKWKQDKFYKK